MKVEKITQQTLLSLIREKAQELRRELNEEESKSKGYSNEGEPMEVKMNPNDGLEDTKQQYVNASADGAKKMGDPFVEDEGEPIEQKMDRDPGKGNSDEKASTAVAVKAGAKKGGNDVTTGQAKASFESKSGGPKKEVSDPFTDKASEKMNTNDKENDEGTKTYVEAGAAKGGTTATAGQHKATIKEKAPASDKDKRISDAIQLKETYTKQELTEFILSEAKKLAKRTLLEQEMNRLKEELKNL